MTVRSEFHTNEHTLTHGYTLTGIDKGVYYTIRIIFRSMEGHMYINPYWEVAEFYNVMMDPK